MRVRYQGVVNLTHLLLTTMDLVTFSNAQKRYGGSQRERIPLNASTTEAYSSQTIFFFFFVA